MIGIRAVYRPLSSLCTHGQIAQWLEHLGYYQKVLGSIPSLDTLDNWTKYNFNRILSGPGVYLHPTFVPNIASFLSQNQSGLPDMRTSLSKHIHTILTAWLAQTAYPSSSLMWNGARNRSKKLSLGQGVLRYMLKRHSWHPKRILKTR